MAELVGLIVTLGSLVEITLAVFANLYRYGDVKSAPATSADLRSTWRCKCWASLNAWKDHSRTIRLAYNRSTLFSMRQYPN
jgi:hypothetical protein